MPRPTTATPPPLARPTGPSNRERATQESAEDLDEIPSPEQIEERIAKHRAERKRLGELRDAMQRQLSHVSATMAPTVIEGVRTAEIQQFELVRLLSSAVDRLVAKEERSAEQMVQALQALQAGRPVDSEYMALHKQTMTLLRARMLHMSIPAALVWGAGTAVFAVTSLLFMLLFVWHIATVTPSERARVDDAPRNTAVPR